MAEEDLNDLSNLQLSSRVVHSLEHRHVTTVSALLQRSEAQLLRIPNLGARSVAEIKRALAAKGLTLPG